MSEEPTVIIEDVRVPRRGAGLLARVHRLTATTNGRVMRATLVIASATLLVKSIVVVRELLAGWKFGTTDSMDAFFIAFLIPSFTINILAGSYSASFIPTFILVSRNEGEQEAQKLFSGVMAWSTAFLFLATILLVVLAPIYLPYLARGFNREKLGLTYKLLCVLAPMVFFGGIQAIWASVLNGREQFMTAALVPIITPILCVIAIAGLPSMRIYALAGGITTGSLLEVVVLGLALRKSGLSPMPRWHGLDSNARLVARQHIPMMAGALLMGGTQLVDQSMAAMLPGGSVASLNYGNRVIAFVTSLSATALGTAIIPYASVIVAQRDWSALRRMLARYLLVIFGLALPFTVALVAFSRPIVTVIYQRGEFGPEDATLVARILAFYALQIPFYIGSILVVRLISTLRANQVLLWASSINLIVNIVLNLLFMKWLGVAGIALSTSGVYLISFTFCLALLFRIMPPATSVPGSKT